MIYIFWTCANEIEAKKIAHGLLEKKAIACASILPGALSIYRWEGKVEEANEVKVILKTMRERFDEVKDYILEHSSYEIPEIASVNIDRANPAYLQWLSKVIK